MLQRNGLFATECVSFPRSGHHLLTNLLREYFGCQTLVYHSLYEDKGRPISDPESLVNYQKNHDFELDTPLNPELKYVVQIRDPMDSIASWRALDARTGTTTVHDRVSWEIETRDRLDYWRKFVDKWVIQSIPNRLIVHYADLLSRPEEVLVNVVQHLRGRQDTDYAWIRKAIESVKPAPRPSNRPPYYFSA